MSTAKCALEHDCQICVTFASLLTLRLVLIVVGSEQCHLRNTSQLKVYLFYRLSYSFFFCVVPLMKRKRKQ